jgi:hypothetical protein
MEVAIGRVLIDERSDALEAGLVGVRIHPRLLFAAVLQQAVVDEAVQRRDLGRRVAFVPEATRPASMTATVAPDALSSAAAVRPVMPAPITTTSTWRRPENFGYCVSSVVPTQSDGLRSFRLPMSCPPRSSVGNERTSQPFDEAGRHLSRVPWRLAR